MNRGRSRLPCENDLWRTFSVQMQELLCGNGAAASSQHILNVVSSFSRISTPVQSSGLVTSSSSYLFVLATN